MTRFTWPALAMIAAMIVLFAGAFADLPTWRHELPANVAPAYEPRPVNGQRPPAAQLSTETAARQDDTTAQRQARDLETRIGRETQELASLRASTDQARRELALLRAQRQREQGQREQDQREQEQTEQDAPGGADRQPAAGDSVAGAPASADGIAASAGGPTTAPATHKLATSQLGLAAAPSTVRQTDTAWHVVANMSSVTRQEQLDAVRRLAAARTALVSGREVRARRLLSLARSQMLHWPTSEASSNASAGDPPATAVEIAIAQLNRGDQAAAARTIDQVMAATGGDSSERAVNTN
jgi:hypothetical protein